MSDEAMSDVILQSHWKFEALEEMERSKSVGRTVDKNDGRDADVKVMIIKAKAASQQLINVCKSPHFSSNTRIRIPNTVLKHVQLHGEVTGELLSLPR